MVAKGHDFPEVTLSAILDADATLRFPDFRAEERTFAMVAQLAGRSGRGAAGGEVMVQTLAPHAASIESAAAHDSTGFLAGELERRRILRYPPYSHLLRVNLSSESRGTGRRGRRAIAAETALPPPGRFGAARAGADVPGAGTAPPPDPGQGAGPGRDGRRGAADGRAAAADRALKDVSIGVDVDPQ